MTLMILSNWNVSLWKSHWVINNSFILKYWIEMFCLTQYSPVFLFYTPRKHQKPKDLLMFSRGIEKQHQAVMGWDNSKSHSSSSSLIINFPIFLNFLLFILVIVIFLNFSKLRIGFENSSGVTKKLQEAFKIT